MKKKFKILFAGNFYFPIMDKGKKFIVEETIDIEIDKKYNKLIEMCFEINKQAGDLDFGMLAKPIWDVCKEEFKNYKNCWLVPIRLCKFDDEYTCMVDVLREVK